MGWTSPDGFATRLFAGEPLTILVAFLVTVTLPVLLHWYFYTTSPKSAVTPTFLLVGPSNSGKTSLVSLLQRRFAASSSADHDHKPQDTAASNTRTSSAPQTVGLALPGSVALGSNKYRSVNDYELRDAAKNPSRYQIVDTPGHGKLRSDQALSGANIDNAALRGVIFMVDSTALDAADSPAARDTVAYLHDTLLALQKRKLGKTVGLGAGAGAGGKSKGKNKKDVPVLIAANKQDLFTALPAGAIKERLQAEIERMRVSKSKGLSKVDSDPDAMEDDDDILGGGGEEKFSFKLLQDEYDIAVDVVSGAVRGEEAGKGVSKWEEWIGSCL